MNALTLGNAIKEAEKFIKVSKKVEIIHDIYSNGKPWERIREGTKESAACKRASLDLTRALAEMRKP